MKNEKHSWRIMCRIAVFAFLIIGCNAEKPKTSVTEGNLESKDLLEFVPILENYRNGVLANQNGEKIRTQIMTFSCVEGNRAYFCTANTKPLYAQLAAFPYVSYCTFPEDFEPVLSLNGKVVFVEDDAVRERALESNYYAKQNFKTIENPLLAVFYIDVEEIETYSSEGVNIYAAK